MEAARMLPLHVSYRYGKVSMEETLRLLHSVTLTDEEVGKAADAMEYLTAVNGAASKLDDDPVH